MDYINHLSLGTQSVVHKDKKIVKADSDKIYDFLESINVERVEVGYIPAGYEHRPDLISYYFYNTVKNDWIIMMYNNISDPFQQLNVGDRLLIPII
jgi:hypothetical protein